MHGWSPELIENTRASIRDLAFVPFGDALHFKNADTRFGSIEVSDIIIGRLLLVDKKTGQKVLYADAEALIGDGWVVD